MGTTEHPFQSAFKGADDTITFARRPFACRCSTIEEAKKRWNVQYGLHPNRDPISVPYLAKGIPSDQAEWGHLDVGILFTCLAFYHGGLNMSQLRQSVEHVVKSDDPSSEYDRGTLSSETLPNTLREWSVINIDDDSQLTEVWRYLRYNVVVIDYFLNHFVFPKHAKQF